LLNLSRLGEIARSGSLFDPIFSAFLERAKFLQSFMQQLTRPVTPSHVALDYLPTQAAADFLASMGNHPLDGILYPSVQSDRTGLNVVLFHRASRAAELQDEDGVELEAETWEMHEDGPERDYRVIEWLPGTDPSDNQAETKKDPSEDGWEIDGVDWLQRTERPVSLRISRGSLQVRLVRQTIFVTEDYDVNHMRIEKGSTPIAVIQDLEV
jgi:hypothetical protein